MEGTQFVSLRSTHKRTLRGVMKTTGSLSNKSLNGSGSRKALNEKELKYESPDEQNNREEIYKAANQGSAFITFLNISSKESSARNAKNDINNPSISYYKSSLSKTQEKHNLLSYDYVNCDKIFQEYHKEKKKVPMPVKDYHIDQNKIIHDTNEYNRKHVIKDHTLNYVRDSYKIRQLYEKDRFVNDIKTDLFGMKFSGKIKLFNNL